MIEPTSNLIWNDNYTFSGRPTIVELSQEFLLPSSRMHVGYRSVQTIKLVHFPGPAIERKAPIVLLLFLEESSTPSCFIVDLIFVLLQAPFFSAWKLFTAYWIIINSCAVCAPVKVSLSRDETEKGGLRILTERKCTIKLISVGLTIPPDPPQKKHD